MNIFDKLFGNLFHKLHIKAFNRGGFSPQNQANIKNSNIGVFQQSNSGIINYNLVQEKNLETFLVKIDKSQWNSQFIMSTKTYTCLEDSSYQVEIGEKHQPFNEPWSDVFPDKNNSWLIPVYLKINGQIIQEVLFVSCDGGRIFVPIPTMETNTFYWDRNSLEFKLAKIIGEFYKYNNIAGVANVSGILIR